MKKFGDVEAYSRKDPPFGLPWEKWVELWWKWCYAYSQESNPVTDTSGELSSKGQIHSTVWFLAGTFGGNVRRTSQIPFGKAIFLPIVNDIISFYTDPFLKSEADLHQYAKEDLDHATFLYASLDGTEVKNLKSYRVHSYLFQIALRRDKEMPVQTLAVSDGYWIFLKPLTRGKHKIEFIGEKLEFDRLEYGKGYSVTNVPKFRVEVEYLLEIF